MTRRICSGLGLAATVAGAAAVTAEGAAGGSWGEKGGKMAQRMGRGEYPMLIQTLWYGTRLTQGTAC